MSPRGVGQEPGGMECGIDARDGAGQTQSALARPVSHIGYCSLYEGQGIEGVVGSYVEA